jgi:autotransporter-associated beta strand protein
MGNLTAPDFTILGTVADAPIQTFTWNGGSSGLWNYTDTNWLDGSGASSAFLADNNATFSIGATASITNTGVSVGFLSNNVPSGQSTTLRGGILNAASIINVAEGNLLIESTNSAATLVNSGLGTLSLVAPGTYTTVDLTAGKIETLADGVLSGAVNASGDSTLDVGTFSNTIGALTVSESIIVGTGILKGAGFGFALDQNDRTVAVSMQGTGGLSKTGSKTLTLSGSNSFSGDISILSGTIATLGADRLPDTTVVTMSANTILSLGGNETIKSLYASSANASAQVNLQSYILTMNVTASNQFVGSLVGTGSMVKNGSSILTLNEPNTFSGGTTLNAGSFRLQASGNPMTNPDGKVTLDSSPFGVGTLTLAGGAIYSSTTSGRNIYNNVDISGNFALGNGTNASGAITVSTNVTGAYTRLLVDSTFTANTETDWEQPILGSGFNLRKGGTNKLTLRSTNALGTLSVLAGRLDSMGSNSIAQVNVEGGAALAYAVTSTPFGNAAINLSNGAIFGQSDPIGTTLSDRTISNQINVLGNVSFGIGAYTGSGGLASYLSGNVDLGGANRTLTLGNTTYLYGAVTNGGLVVDRGSADPERTKTLVLYGANTYSGGTRVIGVAGRTTNNPSLYLAHDNALGTGELSLEGGGDLLVKAISPNSNFADATRLITNAIAISSGVKGLFDAGSTSVVPLDGSSATTVINLMTLSGAISGAGSFEKTNDGVVTLRGNLTYSGGTVVSGGTLKIQKTGLTADITTNTIAFVFNPPPSAGTIEVLPGALVGTYEPASFSGLAVGQTATFTQSSGEVVVTQAALTPTITVTPAVGGYTYSGSMQGPGVDEVNMGGSTGGVTLSYAGIGSTTYGPSDIPPINAGTYTLTATVAADSTYNEASSTPTAFTIAKATPTVSAAPTASAVTVGALLSSSNLSGGTASVEGTFAWTDSSAVVNETASYPVTFTPTDGANYNTASSTASVTANRSDTSDANLLDTAFGAPIGGVLDASLKPTVAVTGGNLVLTYNVRQGTLGLTVTAQTSADLAAGSAGWGTSGITDVAVGAPRTVNGVSVQERTASVSASGGKKFLRIKVVQTP